MVLLHERLINYMNSHDGVEWCTFGVFTSLGGIDVAVYIRKSEEPRLRLSLIARVLCKHIGDSMGKQSIKKHMIALCLDHGFIRTAPVI
jgi:hypothetical protein